MYTDNTCPQVVQTECTEVRTRPNEGSGIARCGEVEGITVSDIILDTGSARTMIRSELVPEETKTDGEIPIRCAHGDTITYPLAQVEI